MSRLTDIFDTTLKLLVGETLEQVRDNYYIAAKMHGCDDHSVGGLNINVSGRQDRAIIEKKKREQATQDMILMSLLDDQLADLEKALADKYGDDFAEVFAAEFLDDETYKTLMQIEDPEERRRAIAKAINDGIASGTIDPEEVYKNPDVKEWLAVHQQKRQQLADLDYTHATLEDEKKAEQSHVTSEGAKEEAVFDNIFAKKL